MQRTNPHRLEHSLTRSSHFFDRQNVFYEILLSLVSNQLRGASLLDFLLAFQMLYFFYRCAPGPRSDFGP